MSLCVMIYIIYIYIHLHIMGLPQSNGSKHQGCTLPLNTRFQNDWLSNPDDDNDEILAMFLQYIDTCIRLFLMRANWWKQLNGMAWSQGHFQGRSYTKSVTSSSVSTRTVSSSSHQLSFGCLCLQHFQLFKLCLWLHFCIRSALHHQSSTLGLTSWLKDPSELTT